MADPLIDRDEARHLLDIVAEAAHRYLGEIDNLPAVGPEADDATRRFLGDLPEDGVGGRVALRRLVADGMTAATHSSGPRFFHFVTGGSTPAAMAADWFTSLIDNNAGMWVSSPLASRLEHVSLEWLKQLLDLPADWGGVTTTGATMANFTALGAARQWWGEQHDANIAEAGMHGLPAVPVLATGFVHASVRKALSMLALGHGTVRVFSADNATPVDLHALENALEDLHGEPAIVVATAGEVNAGRFDPIDEMADIAHRHNSWLHVDGAFGLIARVSPTSSAPAQGVERADSAIFDGHKWLNVPYDCGFAFVRDARLLNAVFGMGAPYFPDRVAEHPDFLYLGPEMSRRARGLAVWTSLCAYGRLGYQALVERHLALARRLADTVRASDDFELLAEPVINVVCFRYHPRGMPEPQLDDVNRRLGQAIVDDGRVYFGTTVYGGKVAFRPAISNWRTTAHQVDEIVPITRGLGERMTAGSTPSSTPTG